MTKLLQKQIVCYHKYMKYQSHNPFYITTPIFYPNGRLHIGHAYSISICDMFARIARILQRPTYFLTGTDENSLKVEKNADEAKMDVMTYLDTMADISKGLFEYNNLLIK